MIKLEKGIRKMIMGSLIKWEKSNKMGDINMGNAKRNRLMSFSLNGVNE